MAHLPLLSAIALEARYRDPTTRHPSPALCLFLTAPAAADPVFCRFFWKMLAASRTRSAVHLQRLADEETTAVSLRFAAPCGTNALTIGGRFVLDEQRLRRWQACVEEYDKFTVFLTLTPVLPETVSELEVGCTLTVRAAPPAVPPALPSL